MLQAVRPKATRHDDRPLSLKVHLLKAEVTDTLLYGCVPWTLNAAHYDGLRKAHLEDFRRVVGFQRRADHTNLSYAKVLKNTKCESIETTIRKRRLFFAGAMLRQNKGRLPSRMMFAQIAGGKNPGPRGTFNNWLRTLRDDLTVFRSTEGSKKDFVFGSCFC